MTTEIRTLIDALAAFEKLYDRYVPVTAVLPSVYGAVIRTETTSYLYNLLTEEITEVKNWKEGH